MTPSFGKLAAEIHHRLSRILAGTGLDLGRAPCTLSMDVEGDRMPLYEYYCEPCNGVFELLRPARDASKLQPCPQCDEDSKRIVSKQWSAFVFREGAARRLPDDGGYWHLGQKVAQPLTGVVQGFEAPEVRPARPSHAPPAVDDITQSEFRQEIKADVDPEARGTFFKARPRTGARKEVTGERTAEAAKPAKRRTKPDD